MVKQKNEASEKSKQIDGIFIVEYQKQLFAKLKQLRELRELVRGSSSEQEHRANALASGAEEGRDKLRKAAGSCK